MNSYFSSLRRITLMCFIFVSFIVFLLQHLFKIEKDCFETELVNLPCPSSTF